jgi:hypothetical protein
MGSESQSEVYLQDLECCSARAAVKGNGGALQQRSAADRLPSPVDAINLRINVAVVDCGARRVTALQALATYLQLPIQ